MTQLLFQEALLNCYASGMEKYYSKTKTPFKILIVVDNAPRLPPLIGDLDPIAKWCLSLQTPSLVPPMDGEL